MPEIRQKYTLGSRHQLIDLNKELVNFRLEFQVFSVEPQKEFEALVVEQGQLDSTSDLKMLEMKKANGKIGGSILADKNVYQNYFLVLKASDTPVEVEVVLHLEEVAVLAPTPSPLPPPLLIKNGPFYQQRWFIFLMVGLVIAACLYYYLFHLKASSPPVPALEVDTPKPEVEEHKPDVSLYSKLRSIT